MVAGDTFFYFNQLNSVRLLAICDFNRESMHAREEIQNLELHYLSENKSECKKSNNKTPCPCCPIS